MAETKLETAEKLEQLRMLQNGCDIKVVITGYTGIGIDTREDYDRFVAIWKERNQQA
jgi:3-deoxy-manno-octulosonate cytidylyltransferase (CMP-KDO synthetase)